MVSYSLIRVSTYWDNWPKSSGSAVGNFSGNNTEHHGLHESGLNHSQDVLPCLG